MRPLGGQDLASPEGVATTVRDRLTAELEHSRALVESVNHHLRNPLTAIIGNAELLLESPHALPAEVLQSIASVLRVAWRLHEVAVGICEVLDAACVHPNNVDTVDVLELLTDEVAACLDRAAERGVRVSIYDSTTVGRCVADAGRLRRAIRELLDNALTYAPDQSTVQVGVASAITGIRIEVSDTGDGIDPADRERLAWPFERGNHPRQPMTGRGMGLALASAVAAAHGAA